MFSCLGPIHFDFSFNFGKYENKCIIIIIIIIFITIIFITVIIIIELQTTDDDVNYMPFNNKKTKPHITYHHSSKSVDLKGSLPNSNSPWNGVRILIISIVNRIQEW